MSELVELRALIKVSLGAVTANPGEIFYAPVSLAIGLVEVQAAVATGGRIQREVRIVEPPQNTMRFGSGKAKYQCH